MGISCPFNPPWPPPGPVPMSGPSKAAGASGSHGDTVIRTVWLPVLWDQSSCEEAAYTPIPYVPPTPCPWLLRNLVGGGRGWEESFLEGSFAILSQLFQKRVVICLLGGLEEASRRVLVLFPDGPEPQSRTDHLLQDLGIWLSS